MRPFYCLLFLPLAACATLADAATGDQDLPNAGAGPFRELRKGELGLSLVAPNAVDDQVTLLRDASVIDLDGDPSTFEVAGFFAASINGAEIDEAPITIRRTTATDGRSFDRKTTMVLEASLGWEQGTVGAPSALIFGGEVLLYYAAAGGIGLAKSQDGLMFTKEPGPVLEAPPQGWDAGATPASPSVIALPSGELAMFYEVSIATGRAIGEARSADGIVWARVGDAPALERGPAGDEAYDDAGVGAPCVVLAETALGRPLARLYYSAESSAGEHTIGLAARLLDGAFERGVAPVLGAGSSRAPREPSVLPFGDFVLLFATQHRSGTNESPAVAAAVAPAQATLPPVASEEL